MSERLTADISHDLRASAQDLRAEHRNTDAGLLTEAADKLDGLIALLAEAEAKLRDEVSDEKCGGDGCPGCPGCTALTADRDRLREDWEYRGHQLDDAATVGRALIDERDRLADTVRQIRAAAQEWTTVTNDLNVHTLVAEILSILDAHLPEVGEPGSNLGADDPDEADAALGEAEEKLRRYEPVIEAAKAWRVAARASEVFRLEASLETGTTMADLSTAVDALDASPGDAQTGPRDEDAT